VPCGAIQKLPETPAGQVSQVGSERLDANEEESQTSKETSDVL
jgi:hypothetical protein